MSGTVAVAARVGLGFGRPKSRPAWSRPRSIPGEREADVTRYATGVVEDLRPEPVALGAQMLAPEVVELARLSNQRIWPGRLVIVEGPSAVRTQLAGEAKDQASLLPPLAASRTAAVMACS